MIYPISWAYSWPYLATALVVAYLIGSVPFGLILTRLAGLGDIRKVGSGNIGATNVLRTGNKALAAATLLLDGGKGAVAVLIALDFGPDVTVIAALGVVLGHLFPVWLGFRGGKGMATTLGVWLALAPPVGALAAAVWLAVAALFRYSSLAALAATAATPPLAYWLSVPQKAEMGILIALLVWLRHAGNIKRLLTGKEPKIGASAGKGAEPRDANNCHPGESRGP